MGNFEALVAEIARRRRQRRAITALAAGWGVFLLGVLGLPGLWV